MILGNSELVEGKDSRIKWEKANSNTKQEIVKIILDSYKPTVLTMNRIAAPILSCTPVALIALFLIMAKKISAPSYLVILFGILYISFGAVLFVVSLTHYQKTRPYLYPERQKAIWVFRAKCTSLKPHLPPNQRHYAYFHKGGSIICIRIPFLDYQSNPVGKEYLFYKFNEKTGNRWAAIPADQLAENQTENQLCR